MAKDPEIYVPDLPQNPPRSPFAGFWIRLLAFGVDGALLWGAGWALDRFARPAMLGLNPWLPWISQLLGLIYFWIGYGPHAGGQTVGKRLVGLQVADAGGRSLTHGAALRRALTIQFALFALILFFHRPDQLTLPFPAQLFYPVSLVLVVLIFIGVTLLLVLGIGLAFHPHKRGLHDLWAGSYVTPAPVSPAFHETLAGNPDPFTGRRIALNARIQIFFWALSALALSIRPITTFTSQEFRSRVQNIVKIQRDIGLGEYQIVDVRFPSATQRDLFNQAILDMRNKARASGQAVPTTDSVRQDLENRFPAVNGETIGVRLHRRHGRVTGQELNMPAFMAAIEGLRRGLLNEARSQAVRTTDTLPARDFEARLFEPFNFLLYNGRRSRARVHGPADPAAGELNFEMIEAARTGDAVSTQSAVSPVTAPHEPRTNSTQPTNP